MDTLLEKFETHFLKLNSDNKPIDKPVENHLTSPIKNNSPQPTQNSQNQSISQIHNNKPIGKVLSKLKVIDNQNKHFNSLYVCLIYSYMNKF
jgi:hypothetical protein